MEEKQEISLYTIGTTRCWRCGWLTKVYSWKNKELWDTRRPPEPVPATIKWLNSMVHPVYYWANTCEHCHVILGDFYLFREDEVTWEK